ncbi:MAG TPA: TetR/AcrR family transcriptional regulator [Acidimicrobiales bacterium]|nr:TetR/AcrR family transcriptional regulator [Acidimicrobiales bacterium]
MPGLTATLARRALEQRVADRQSAYETEVERFVAAAYRLIERTGGVDPSLRDLLAEAGLSTQAFYRFFKSKDEFMLVLLDDGRRKLLGYLEHRMAAETTPSAKVRAWIEGVLAQASNPEAAARTRPFVANRDRLSEAFPREQQESVDLLVELLLDPVTHLQRTGDRRVAPRQLESARHDAEAVYTLVVGTLEAHLARRTRPTAQEVQDLVGFALRALGASPAAPRNAARRRAPAPKRAKRRTT